MESSLCFKYRARPVTTNWKGRSSDIKGSAPPHSFHAERTQKRNDTNPWRTRGDRNSRWKDTVVGAYRRHRWAQKARKRPVAIRLAGWDRRWHRTKLESTASVAVRIERGKRDEKERGRIEREWRVSIVGRQSLNGRGTGAMNEERAWIRGWIEVLDSPRGRWSRDCSAIFIVIECSLPFIFAFEFWLWN